MVTLSALLKGSAFSSHDCFTSVLALSTPSVAQIKVFSTENSLGVSFTATVSSTTFSPKHVEGDVAEGAGGCFDDHNRHDATSSSANS